MLAGSFTGRGRRISASISEKAAVHAPIASDRETTAAAVTTAFFRQSRRPKVTSKRIDSSQGKQLDISARPAQEERVAKLSAGLRFRLLRAHAAAREFFHSGCEVKLDLVIEVAAQTIPPDNVQKTREPRHGILLRML